MKEAPGGCQMRGLREALPPSEGPIQLYVKVTSLLGTTVLCIRRAAGHHPGTLLLEMN